MTQLKETQKLILEAIEKASENKPRKIFTGKDKEGKSLFAMIPYPLLLNSHVTMMDIGVYAIILGYCVRSKSSSIKISQRKIADALETNQRIVSRSILVLESLDWLKVERHMKAISTYSPRRTETSKAKKIRKSKVKFRRKKSEFQKEFLRQLAEAEEARKKFLTWFASLSDEEAGKYYQEHKEDMDYISEED